ncbi:hypothetical protein ACTWQB_00745 [Piscibacillus sp. B03]|uniref:hypothetical protein n=1 Tax=Piscibacillus sp. B03 TaxID=3457430 RepID=UPI003FCD9226
MKRFLLRTFTFITILIHLVIFYFWIFDWTKLVTNVGLSVWGGSILLGAMLYYIGRGKSKRFILLTTLMTIFLATMALFIEMITTSMP